MPGTAMSRPGSILNRLPSSSISGVPPYPGCVVASITIGSGGSGGVFAPSLFLRDLWFQTTEVAVLPYSDFLTKLRDDHGVYMAGSGRINVAGLHAGNIEKFIGALAAVTGS